MNVQDIAKEAITLGLIMTDTESTKMDLAEGVQALHANEGADAVEYLHPLRLSPYQNHRRALCLESETEQDDIQESQESTFQEEAPDPTPESLPTERVRELVEATNLPDAARTRLLAAEYGEEASLQEAIQAEVTYIKEITHSGQPFAQGRSTTQPEPVTEETRIAKFNEIMRAIGSREV